MAPDSIVIQSVFVWIQCTTIFIIISHLENERCLLDWIRLLLGSFVNYFSIESLMNSIIVRFYQVLLEHLKSHDTVSS